MKFTAFLFLLLVVKSFSLRCNLNYECTGGTNVCDAFKSTISSVINVNSDSKIQTCGAGEDRCGVIV